MISVNKKINDKFNFVLNYSVESETDAARKTWWLINDKLFWGIGTKVTGTLDVEINEK